MRTPPSVLRKTHALHPLLHQPTMFIGNQSHHCLTRRLTRIIGRGRASMQPPIWCSLGCDPSPFVCPDYASAASCPHDKCDMSLLRIRCPIRLSHTLHRAFLNSIRFVSPFLAPVSSLLALRAVFDRARLSTLLSSSLRLSPALRYKQPGLFFCFYNIYTTVAHALSDGLVCHHSVPRPLFCSTVRRRHSPWRRLPISSDQIWPVCLSSFRFDPGAAPPLLFPIKSNAVP
jgi:hypothetical protein